MAPFGMALFETVPAQSELSGKCIKSDGRHSAHLAPHWDG